jgi:hypothetical protein
VDLRVATINGKPLSFADAMIRFALRVLTVLSGGLGLWQVWRDPQGRAWHDRLSKTVVVGQHVTPGILRAHRHRPKRSRDAMAAVCATVAAVGLMGHVAPQAMASLQLSDRFQAAMEELAPAIAHNDLVREDGRWSPLLSRAHETIERELNLSLAIDSFHNEVVLIAKAQPRDAFPEAGRAVVRLTRSAYHDMVVWSCEQEGLIAYAIPRSCRELGSKADRGSHVTQAMFSH